MNFNSFAVMSGWAVIIWGVVATTMLLQFSVSANAIVGAGFAIISAGLTYLFQVVQFHYVGEGRSAPGWVLALGLLPVIAWSVGLLAALNGV